MIIIYRLTANKALEGTGISRAIFKASLKSTFHRFIHNTAVSLPGPSAPGYADSLEGLLYQLIRYVDIDGGFSDGLMAYHGANGGQRNFLMVHFCGKGMAQHGRSYQGIDGGLFGLILNNALQPAV